MHEVYQVCGDEVKSNFKKNSPALQFESRFFYHHKTIYEWLNEITG